MSRKALFTQALDGFPASLREELESIVEDGGKLSAERCRAALDVLDVPVENLMQRLLPLARRYSCPEISGFRVGAVAKARMSPNETDVALFLGANIEFPRQTLTQAIHAEQSAVVNAWLAGATQIDSLAVTAAPCGGCRQFICEMSGGRNVEIILAHPRTAQVSHLLLQELLPEAFCPQDLGVETGLMEAPRQVPDLDVEISEPDTVVLEALATAKLARAPYSKNYAGCAIETTEGNIYAGRYAENAAFAPSLSPLQTAVIKMTMDSPEREKNIRRAVLVEKPAVISQRDICELLLKSVAPDVTLEYFDAIERTAE
jgi:cytidine deaminase